MMDPSQYRVNRDRPDLEEILERIVSNIKMIEVERRKNVSEKDGCESFSDVSRRDC